MVGTAVHLAKVPGGGFAGGVHIHVGAFTRGASHNKLLYALTLLKAGANEVDRAVKIVAQGRVQAQKGIGDADGGEMDDVGGFGSGNGAAGELEVAQIGIDDLELLADGLEGWGKRP